MNKIRCKPCNGSGKVMGGGMMLADCDNCDGVGKLYVEEPFKMDKESPHYKNAIGRIKELNPALSDNDCEVIFNRELETLDDIKEDANDSKKTADNVPEDGRPDSIY